MTEKLQCLPGIQPGKKGCPGKALSFAETPLALNNTSPASLPNLSCLVLEQKHTEPVRNIHLFPSASKSTGWRKLSVEADSFRAGGRGTKSRTPSQLCHFPSHTNVSQPQHSPASYSKVKKERLGLSLLLSVACLLQNGVARWEVMSAGLRKTVGMLKYKGQVCRERAKGGTQQQVNFETCYCCKCIFKYLIKQTMGGTETNRLKRRVLL